jgi:hypothetical protein
MVQQKREGPMAKRYLITLTDDERAHLLALTKKGQVSARTLSRAHTLLQADAGAPDAAIAAALHLGLATVERIRTRFVVAGLAAALTDRARPGGRRKLVGKPEAFPIALACSPPPDGRQRWTMQLRADKLVELRVVEVISDETVRRTRKQTSSSPGKRKAGAFPV